MDALMHLSTSNPPRRTSNSCINLPVHFVSGSFAGQTLRAELTEIQKADLGRKYARVDRRPLDPPPVVLLKLYHVFNHGTEAQYESEIEDYSTLTLWVSEVNTLGLLCNVDLFPVPAAARDPSGAAISHRRDLHQAHASHHEPLPPPAEPLRPAPLYPLYHSHAHLASIQLPPLTLPTRPALMHTTTTMHQQPPTLGAQHILTYFWDQPITEDMNCTTALSGATFIQPAMIEHKGRKSLVFPFADLAVKTEGQFFLRYRCFDIFSQVSSGHGDLPIQAECFGGPFRIYSTKEFPGLQPSTELTKQLARWGVRLNTRETERKRKRKDDNRSSSSFARPTRTRAGKTSDSDSS